MHNDTRFRPSLPQALRHALFALLAPALVTLCACAQKNAGPLGNHLQYVRIESEALRGNLAGDPWVREMAVLLPPSYFLSAKARYPAVYYLHGLGTRKDGHRQSAGLFEKLFELMKKRQLAEMILVAVDGTTAFGGSYYANSPTIGNFEEYVAREIVARVDSLFRTQPDRQGRAVAGFSMGGHGAIKIAMKYSDVFAQVASLSGSPLSMRYRRTIYRNALAKHGTPRSLKELQETVTFENNWSQAAAYAKAAAFSPNLRKPPLYLDLPFETAGSEGRDTVWQKWLDDDPLSLVARHSADLRTLDMIYLDHGDDETTLGTEDFIRELVRYGIGVTYHVFRGDHVDELFLRHVRMLRTFSTRWQYPG